MKMRSFHQASVDEFMHKAGQELPTSPCVPGEDVRELRARLILEEALETISALGITIDVLDDDCALDMANIAFRHTHEPDLIEIADGCADLSVVTIGTLSACGISDVELLGAVDASNLDKFSGDAHRRDDGKWVKPTTWWPPDIALILKKQGWQG